MSFTDRIARLRNLFAAPAPAAVPTVQPRRPIVPGKPPEVAARDSPVQMWIDLQTVDEMKQVLNLQRQGFFQLSSLLAEGLSDNPRARGVIDTRLNGSMSTSIRWEPARNNELARRAARAAEEDWPLMAPIAARRQRKKWGLHLGAAPTQKHWFTGPSGRLIPRIEPFHPFWCTYQPIWRCYQLTTRDGLQIIPSPGWIVPNQPLAPDVAPNTLAHPMQWMVHEPWGPNSHREALIYPTAQCVFESDMARRARGRWVNKHGLAIMRLYVPETEYAAPANRDGDVTAPTNATPRTVDMIINALRNAGRELVVPLIKKRIDTESWDVDYMEPSGNGYDGIRMSIADNNVDLSVLWGGNNLVSEVKGGAFAAMQGALSVRGEALVFDWTSEAADDRPHLLGDWAEVNFGDRALAPIPVGEVDPPQSNEPAARTIMYLAYALGVLTDKAPDLDVDALLARFRLPLLPDEKRAAKRAMLAGDRPPATPEATAAAASIGRMVEQALSDGVMRESIDAAVAAAVEGMTR